VHSLWPCWNIVPSSLAAQSNPNAICFPLCTIALAQALGGIRKLMAFSAAELVQAIEMQHALTAIGAMEEWPMAANATWLR